MVPIDSISQRDLRSRSKEIMDAVERGERFVITRDGREIAELSPLKPRSRFVSREQLLLLSGQLRPINRSAFMADLAEGAKQEMEDPYDRG